MACEKRTGNVYHAPNTDIYSAIEIWDCSMRFVYSLKYTCERLPWKQMTPNIMMHVKTQNKGSDNGDDTYLMEDTVFHSFFLHQIQVVHDMKKPALQELHLVKRFNKVMFLPCRQSLPLHRLQFTETWSLRKSSQL